MAGTHRCTTNRSSRVVTVPARRRPASRVLRGPAAIVIRPIRPRDREALERFYQALSPGSRRDRFFSIVSGLTERQARQFCTPDHAHDEGFIAVLEEGPGRRRVVGHLCLEPDGSDAAEVAIAVADEFQGRGIGHALMTAALDWAVRRGLARLTATMLAGNGAIYRLLAGLGLPAMTRASGPGVVGITIPLASRKAA
jgi:RimJ/RimL family protein N-acetyltransferase